MSYENFMHKLTKTAMRIFPRSLHDWLSMLKAGVGGYGQPYYAQDGIDAVLKSKIGVDKKIFYVDVGANHPYWASNTYAFYRNGSHGINIDAAPGSMKLFKIARRRDINLEVPISNSKKTLKFYMFYGSALSGFDEKLSKERSRHHKIEKVIDMQPKTLAEILGKHLPRGQKIDLLSVDTEGHDLNVLKSNDFSKYRPKFIIVEELSDSLEKIRSGKIYAFLKSKGYVLSAFTEMNSLYVLKKN